MELESLLKIIDKVSSSELTEFCYEEGNLKLNLKKKKTEVMAAPVPETVSVAPAPKPAAASEREKPLEGNVVKAPLVGTFYTSPAPDQAPFVLPGDRVSKGQTVCLIEAMKMMSEVPAPCDCVIESVCKSNGELVAFGEPLFRYKPC